MSLVSMGTIAVGRDLTSPGQPISDAIASESQAPPTGAGAAANLTSFGQLLVAQIPTEALLGYTTLLALFTASPPGSYEAGRWGLYGVAIVVCALAVLVSYVAQRNQDLRCRTAGPAARSRRVTQPWPPPHLPYLPVISSSLSMAVYGLSVPGSPLQYAVSPSAFAILSGCLAVGGGVMMSIFAPILGRGNAVTTTGPTPTTVGDSAHPPAPVAKSPSHGALGASVLAGGRATMPRVGQGLRPRAYAHPLRHDVRRAPTARWAPSSPTNRTAREVLPSAILKSEADTPEIGAQHRGVARQYDDRERRGRQRHAARHT